MKISVLVPCFNAANFIFATLESVRKQNYDNLEVIIVDGASTDSTREIIASFGPLISTMLSEPDCGQLDALQKAAKLATGEVCFFLNADDIVLPGAFRYVSKVFESFPETEIVFSDDYAFSESDRRLSYGSTVRGMTFKDHFLFYRQMYSECVYWRRELTANALPVDTSIRVYSDYSFFLPMRHEAKCRWVPKRLGAFRVTANQVSSRYTDLRVKEYKQIKDAMRDRLGMGKIRFRTSQILHVPSFLLRQWIFPRMESIVRFGYRLVSADRERDELTDFFYDSWLVPCAPSAGQLPALGKETLDNVKMQDTGDVQLSVRNER